MNTDALTWGTAARASEVRRFLAHNIHVGRLAEAAGRRKTPACIWGSHGIGKTELVESFAREAGYAWAYIAPAQFEEMGDLLGMPRIEGGRTHFAPPAWVPSLPGPGILLIDDVNRADDRILRGIMQLLQHGALATWALPPDWHIVLTANPDDGRYSVTPMDEALLTRMRHITLRFDVQEWAGWAMRQGIDARGVQFLLSYPELVNEGRNTPRSFVQFFEALAGIGDWGAERELLQLLAEASLDGEAAAAFQAFVSEQLFPLPTAEAWLGTADLDGMKKALERAIGQQGGGQRSDALYVLCWRMAEAAKGPINTAEAAVRLADFAEWPILPEDLRLMLAQEIASSGTPAAKRILAGPALRSLLLTAARNGH